jgi:hypothetical protein
MKPIFLPKNPKEESEKSFEWLKDEISQIIGTSFHGSVTLHFNDGTVKQIEYKTMKRPPYQLDN